MRTQELGQQDVGDGLYTIEAEFVTEHLVIRGEISGPDSRLSDHLNGSAKSVEIRPFSVERAPVGSNVDLAGAHANITKAHLLFIIPVSEPDRPQGAGSAAWTWTLTKRCWAALGRYGLIGTVHAEPGRDPRHILRSLEQKDFLPFTDVTITHPDGSNTAHGAVIVNRTHVELIALRDY